MNKIKGIIFEEGNENLSLWMCEIKDDDNNKIHEILNKYQNDGYSVCNVYEEIKKIIS